MAVEGRDVKKKEREAASLPLLFALSLLFPSFLLLLLLLGWRFL
jgi:hypothetical protein